jgi:hypothetical protein
MALCVEGTDGRGRAAEAAGQAPRSTNGVGSLRRTAIRDAALDRIVSEDAELLARLA